MVIRTFIVNTMPRRSAQDPVTQEGGVLRARGTSPEAPMAAPQWNPFQELESEERVHIRVRADFTALDDETIPNGMEGSYFH